MSRDANEFCVFSFSLSFSLSLFFLNLNIDNNTNYVTLKATLIEINGGLFVDKRSRSRFLLSI